MRACGHPHRNLELVAVVRMMMGAVVVVAAAAVGRVKMMAMVFVTGVAAVIAKLVPGCESG